MALLAEAGIAAFRTPEACADGLRALLSWRAPRPADPPRPAGLDKAEALLRASTGDGLDERASTALFGALGINCVGSTVIAPAALDSHALDVTFPVALKILSPDLPHKTEVGGVALGLADAAAVRAAGRAMLDRIGRSHPTARLAGLLVQPMERGLVEA